MKKILIILILLLFFIPLVLGGEQQTLGTFKKGDCITLTQNCNCTYVNFTAVYKTGSEPKFILQDPTEATKQGDDVKFDELLPPGYNKSREPINTEGEHNARQSRGRTAEDTAITGSRRRERGTGRGQRRYG